MSPRSFFFLRHSVWTAKGRPFLQNRCFTRQGPEEFKIRLKTGQVSFTSSLDDAAVVRRLQTKDEASPFVKSLIHKGRHGEWSTSQRTWAHYLASKESQTTGDGDCEEPGVRSDEITVRIDDRERGLLESFNSLKDLPFPVQCARLPVGDIVIEGGGIALFLERKTYPDLLSSIYDGRLLRQMGGQLHETNYDRSRSLLVVEGSIEDLKHRQLPNYEVSAQTVRSMLLRLGVVDRIPVLRTSSLEETRTLVCDLASNLESFVMSFPSRYSTVSPSPRPRSGEASKDILIEQLCCVRGVVPNMARKLLKPYRSMKAFIKALESKPDPVEWLVNGSGTTKKLQTPCAIRIVETLVGEGALEAHRFRDRLLSINGLTAPAVSKLIAAAPCEKDLTKILGTQRDPVGWVQRTCELASRLPAKALVLQLLGENGLHYERFRERLQAISGLSPANAVHLLSLVSDEEDLCAKLREQSDPVTWVADTCSLKGRKTGVALVSEFLGPDGLKFERFRESLLAVRGLGPEPAVAIAEFWGSERALVEDLWGKQQTTVEIDSNEGQADDEEKRLKATIGKIRKWDMTAKPISASVAQKIAQRFKPESTSSA